MGYVFPNTPTIGEEANGYLWDGEKWTKDISSGGGGPSSALPLANGVAAAGTSPAYSRGDHVHPATGADSSKLNVSGHQVTTGGFRFTTFDAGTLTAGQTLTPDAYNGNYQRYTNNGAHTLAAPANDCAMDILVTNGATAGAITFSGFSVGSVGDTPTTTNGQRFILSIRRINGVSTYAVKALQ